MEVTQETHTGLTIGIELLLTKDALITGPSRIHKAPTNEKSFPEGCAQEINTCPISALGTKMANLTLTSAVTMPRTSGRTKCPPNPSRIQSCFLEEWRITTQIHVFDGIVKFRCFFRSFSKLQLWPPNPPMIWRWPKSTHSTDHNVLNVTHSSTCVIFVTTFRVLCSFGIS